MAHGPVNKAWFFRPAEDVVFKITESTYDKLKAEHPDAIITVLIGNRTDRCIHMWKGAEDCIKAEGYDHKDGNIYGKMAVEYEFTA